MNLFFWLSLLPYHSTLPQAWNCFQIFYSLFIHRSCSFIARLSSREIPAISARVASCINVVQSSPLKQMSLTRKDRYKQQTHTRTWRSVKFSVSKWFTLKIKFTSLYSLCSLDWAGVIHIRIRIKYPEYKIPGQASFPDPQWRHWPCYCLSDSQMTSVMTALLRHFAIYPQTSQ